MVSSGQTGIRKMEMTSRFSVVVCCFTLIMLLLCHSLPLSSVAARNPAWNPETLLGRKEASIGVGGSSTPRAPGNRLAAADLVHSPLATNKQSHKNQAATIFGP